MAEITDVRVRKVMKEGKLKAMVSIVLDNEIAIHEIKIIQGQDKLFVAMPSKKDEATGTFKDIVHPMSTVARDKMEALIIDEYERYILSNDL